MATFRIVVAVFFAATFLASSAFAFNDPCGPRGSPIDCQNSMKTLEIRRQQAEAAGRDKAQFILDINKARAQFWAAFLESPVTHFEATQKAYAAAEKAIDLRRLGKAEAVEGKE